MIAKDNIESGFRPIHKAHAIEQLALGMSFDGELSDEALKAVKAAVGTPADLPGKIELRGFSLGIGGSGVVPANANILGGYGFRKVQPDGSVDTELTIHRGALAFRTMMYTRWTETIDKAMSYFAPILSLYLAELRLVQISLNYIDKFVADGPRSGWKREGLLKSASPYLAPIVFSTEDLWHCHTGRFIHRDRSTKRLVRVNIDMTEDTPEEGVRGVLTINSVLADLFGQPSYEPLALAPEDGQRFVVGRLNELHQLDKEVLGSIISRDMVRRIALES